MKTRRIILYIFLVPVGLFVLLLILGTLLDYRPDQVTLLAEPCEAPRLQDSVFDLMIWNIGYCGLGDNMDFFYDGGKAVRSTHDRVEENLSAVIDYVGSLDAVDFFLLQEVDLQSRRSYRINQLDALQEVLPGYAGSVGLNYKVFFVPLPPSNPYGRVKSGIVTFSRFLPHHSARHAFPGNYAWPMGPFMLDRCFLVDRFQLPGGRELLVVNTHNSAYDDGSLKREQMEFLHGFLTEEFAKGNYIVAGGDWNQTPYGFRPEFQGNIFDTIQLTYIEEDYLPGGWTWAYDPGVPTNRRVDTPYDPNISRTTVIDYYLLSPNLEILDIRGVNLDFRNSDHQPVLARIRLK
jgi:endonuclease/exonuclease/phosphatase family metal-dependent hydrolase